MAKCVDPSALEQGTLLAYIDGKASKQVQMHLENCPYCAEQVVALRRTMATLKATLYRRSCPPPERLALYQLGFLPASERLAMAKHVRECPHCTKELEDLARVEERPSLLERLRRTADVIEAVLVPLPRARVAPLRGTLAAQRFRIADAGLDSSLDILISVLPAHDRGYKTVMGRLLCDQDLLPNTTLEVWLMCGDETWVCPFDAGGTFAFHDVQLGEYDIVLEWQGRVVLIKQVVVK